MIISKSGNRAKTATTIVSKILETNKGVRARVAEYCGVSTPYISFLLNKVELHSQLDDALVSMGYMKKKPPKDPRTRVWMRTDNVDLAVQQLLAHYDPDLAIKALRDNCNQIITIEWYSK